jgi:outer membrane protein assembly factor BamD (BamD/ComL family)
MTCHSKFGSLATALLLLTGFAIADAQRGILVREAVIRITPDETSQRIGLAGRGREVVILNQSHDWINVFANVGVEKDITGWILNKGVVLPSTPNGDKIVFAEAEDSEDQASRSHGRPGAAQDAMHLYASLAELFPKSSLAGEALYRAADIRWQIESADVMSLPSAKEQDPILRSKINEDYMREVMKKFPHTKWADLAAYHLLDNQLCGDWQGQSKCPERETELYEKYVREHPQSPKAAEALYNAARRQAALVEIYKTENESGKSEQAKSKAAAIANQVAKDYADSTWANRALLLAYKIEQNIPTYGSAIE